MANEIKTTTDTISNRHDQEDQQISEREDKYRYTYIHTYMYGCKGGNKNKEQECYV